MACPSAKHNQTVLTTPERGKRNPGRRLQPAVRPVGGVGPEVQLFVPTLVLALQSHDEAVRRTAAESLGDLGTEAKEALAALRQVRQDREESVRNQAEAAVEKICLEIRRAILRAA